MNFVDYNGVSQNVFKEVFEQLMYNVVNLANLNGTVKFIRRIKSQINT